MNARIIVVRQYDDDSEEMDAAIIVQDSGNDIVVYGKDKVIKQNVEDFLMKGNSLDDALNHYNRPPQMWTVEMEDTRYINDESDIS